MQNIQNCPTFGRNTLAMAKVQHFQRFREHSPYPTQHPVVNPTAFPQTEHTQKLQIVEIVESWKEQSIDQQLNLFATFEHQFRSGSVDGLEVEALHLFAWQLVLAQHPFALVPFLVAHKFDSAPPVDNEMGGRQIWSQEQQTFRQKPLNGNILLNNSNKPLIILKIFEPFVFMESADVFK